MEERDDLIIAEEQDTALAERKNRGASAVSYIISIAAHAALFLLAGLTVSSQFPAPAPAGGARTYVAVDIISDQVQEGVVGKVKETKPEQTETEVVTKDTEGPVRVAPNELQPQPPQEKSRVAKKTGPTPMPATGPKPPGAKPGEKANNGMGDEGPGKLWGKPGEGMVVNGSGTAISPFPGTGAGDITPQCTKTDRNVGTRLTYQIEFKENSLSVEHIASDPPADDLTAQNTLKNLKQMFSTLKLEPKPGEVFRNTVECDCGENRCRVTK